ncbi:signal peptidase II, partial [Ruminococcaceae bacterium OttesenSCG-928-A11]|nr:signal peptidase II [Ruminococcaceae bacterium OttesenSCG-928-A11]
MQKKRERPVAGTVVRAVVLVLLLAADQLSKNWVVQNLKGAPPLVLIGGVLELVYTENTGAAFGLFKDGNVLLIVTGLLLVALLCWLYFRLPAGKKWNRLRNTGVVLLAGAAGNLVDRFVHGFVVDFIYFVPI